MPSGDRGGRQRPFLRRRLRDSPRARAEARVARAHGLPRTILLGRPWPAAGEPLFTQEDTDWALALDELEQAEAAAKCPLCGLPATVCRDIENAYQFEASAEVCHATHALAIAQAADAKDRAKDGSSGEAMSRSLAWSAQLKTTSSTRT